MAETVPFAMVGGGEGSWIGDAHRRAARGSGRAVLVAGCFSSSAERSRAFAAAHLPGVEPSRAYGSVEELIEGEAKAPEASRARFVIVCTPNKYHAPQTLALLAAGFHVVCDKPLAAGLEEAERVHDAAAASDRLLALTHNYSGYAMIKEARALVAAGRLGTLRKVLCEYPQGWLTAGGAPARKAATTSLLDLGTHAEHLVRYVTGLRVERVMADAATVVGGVRDPDDYSCLLRFREGARGVLVASQVLTGSLNPLRIRVFGSDASLEWCQETPNTLTLRPRDAPAQTLDRGQPYLSEAALHRDVNKPGHPSGYLDGLAAIYDRFVGAVLATDAGEKPHPQDLDFPSAADGVESLRFVAAVEASSASESWCSV